MTRRRTRAEAEPGGLLDLLAAPPDPEAGARAVLALAVAGALRVQHAAALACLAADPGCPTCRALAALAARWERRALRIAGRPDLGPLSDGGGRCG